MEWIYNDGGRKEAGYKGSTGDCGLRAVCIALELDYKSTYKELVEFVKPYNEKLELRYQKKVKSWEKKFPNMKAPKLKLSHPRTGIHRNVMKDFLKLHGWKHVSMQGKKCRLEQKYFPQGRFICNIPKHFVAVIDGTIHDTYDSTKGKSRRVYGYYVKGD